MSLRDPYAPPKSEVAGIDLRAVPRRLPFPWALVLAWIVGGAITLHATFAAYSVAIGWEHLSDLAIIDPSMNPSPLVLVLAAKLATGILIVLRRRWLFVPLLLWLGGFLYLMLVRVKVPLLSGAFALGFAELLAILGLCACLAIFRRLR